MATGSPGRGVDTGTADKGMQVNANNNVFVPHVSGIEVPSIGKTFETEDEAYMFYKTYAKAACFTIRKQNCTRNRKGEVRLRIFVCSKEGVTNESYQETRKHSEPRTGERTWVHTRCKCKASMNVKRVVKGHGWVISNFVEEHSHPIESPGKVQIMPSYRTLSKSKRKLVDQLSEANVPICHQQRFSESEAGGPSGVGFCERDVRNCKRDLRQTILGHDAESLIYFFEREKSRNPNSFYVYDTEDIEFEDGKVERVFTRCFWADCASRNAYGHFGDAIVFDTTYNMNAYRMILATFVGVNNHRQTAVFGSGLLSDETTDSFKWLFTQFLRCMPDRGVPPQIIITDQDQAIGNAVRELFPNTMHRLCLWHIQNKFSEKLGTTLYNEHKSTLYSTVNDSESIMEFENRWGRLLSSTPLGANEWLRNMYEIRDRWVPAYVRHVFAAGMSSSQRVEANHAFFKRFVLNKNTLGDFILMYWKAVDDQRNEEKKADYIDSQVPSCATSSPMVKQMARIYTKAIFLLFQSEVQQSLWYKSKMISTTDDGNIYEVCRTVGDEESEQVSERAHTLTWWRGSDYVTCSCKLFEFYGYPCRHILRLLHTNEVTYLPDRYILSRWTKKARANPHFQQNKEISQEQTLAMRRSTLAGVAMDVLVDRGSMTEEISKFALSEMLILGRKIDDMIEARLVDAPMPTSRSRDESLNVTDPLMVRTKGFADDYRASKAMRRVLNQESDSEPEPNSARNYYRSKMSHASLSPTSYSTHVHKQDAAITIDQPPSMHTQVERPIPNANTQQLIVYHHTERKSNPAMTSSVSISSRCRRRMEGYAQARCLDRNIASINITERGDTALHIAAAIKQTEFVRKLVECLDKDDLAAKNNDGYTAFCAAAISGVVEIAEVMYAKNKDLPIIRGSNEMTPFQMAISMGSREMAEYLCKITPLRDFDADERMKILEATIHTELYDIALNILEMDRSIVTRSKDGKGRVLLELARKPLPKLTTSHGWIWERLDRILSFVPCFKMIYDLYQMRRQEAQLVKELCDEIMTLPDSEISKLFEETPILSEAAKIGNVEFLIFLTQSYPDLVWNFDSNKHSIFHVAVIHRQERVFCLLYQTGAMKDLLMLTRDTKGNNILHLAGNLAPPNRLNIVSGAALQMQRELVWFKEVKKRLQPSEVNTKNEDEEPKTPKELFTEKHKELRKAGETWMKDTAASCMIVATLIATIAFAAAFTLPGGNNRETGAPIFLKDRWFTVFVISNAVAMFSSLASIMMFLSILTSRYREEAFLFWLPAKLTVGLVMLFGSIVCILLTFSATFFLVYEDERQRTLPTFVASFACLPITYM